jgi:hypothetical protein
MNLVTIQNQQISRKSAGKTGAWRLLPVCFVFVTFILTLAPRAWGQDNATINGTVLDSTGAVVPNAAIILTNPATNQTRTDSSNATGAYRFANLVSAPTPSGLLPPASRNTPRTILLCIRRSRWKKTSRWRSAARGRRLR